MPLTVTIHGRMALLDRMDIPMTFNDESEGVYYYIKQANSDPDHMYVRPFL